MYYLWDTRTWQIVGEYEKTEDAVFALGAAMSLFGPNESRKRFQLTEPPQKTKAKIVMSQAELWQRALVYFDKKVYTNARNRRFASWISR